jgi:acetyl esterase/lipase
MLTRNVTLYEDRRDVTLTTYVLSDSRELLNGKKRPAIVICPGGAYLGCSDREGEPVALRFAAMGYHAFVLRYSTYCEAPFGSFQFAGPMPVNPHSVHPGPLRDIGQAFLTIREHAGEWLVDVDNIGVCGFSAGGHNCGMYAVYWDDPVLSDHFGVASALLRPALAIVGYAILDYRLMFGPKPEPFAKVISDAASIALMGTTEPSDELLRELSPALRVSPNTPPMFLWATADDPMVPAENTTRMATALAQAGVPFEVHIFEKGGHGLSLADQASAGSVADFDADAAKWVEAAGAWLLKRFALDLPTTPAWQAGLGAGGQP